MAERIRITFRYMRGQQVRWLAEPGLLHIVRQQRYTQRDVLGPVYEYLVSRVDDPAWRAHWALEPDLCEI